MDYKYFRDLESGYVYVIDKYDNIDKLKNNDRYELLTDKIIKEEILLETEEILKNLDSYYLKNFHKIKLKLRKNVFEYKIIDKKDLFTEKNNNYVNLLNLLLHNINNTVGLDFDEFEEEFKEFKIYTEYILIKLLKNRIKNI